MMILQPILLKTLAVSCLLLMFCMSPGVVSFSVSRHSTLFVSRTSTTVPPPRRHSTRIRSAPTRGDKTHPTDGDSKKKESFTSLPQKAFKIYTEYAGRLWNETNEEARMNIANDKVAGAIRQIHDISRASEYVKHANVSDQALDELEEACDHMLVAMGRNRTVLLEHKHHSTLETLAPGLEEEEGMELKEQVIKKAIEANNKNLNSKVQTKKKKKPRRSITFGAAMGLVVACWVFSGNYIFTGLFTLMTILGQLEYYRMVINTGVYPARRISVIGAASMFLTALFAPELHQICLPTFGLWAMIWFLTMKRSVTTIPEIATTFTGMFYLGYVPSFWVRIRLLGGNREATRIGPLMEPLLNFFERKAVHLPSFIPQAVHLPITSGAIFIFWSWLCLAFSDVGAYFVGKNFGKTKLGKLAPAAGAASPNKTVEGVLGGCLVSGILGVMGAWVQRWPFFVWTGAIHGVMLGLLGLLGDLTASMLKRDAGLKDFGDLIPEHGGIMDRVDSFVWTAPYSWVICAYILPALRQFVK